MILFPVDFADPSDVIESAEGMRVCADLPASTYNGNGFLPSGVMTIGTDKGRLECIDGVLVRANLGRARGSLCSRWWDDGMRGKLLR